MFGGTFAPLGWELCDGRLLSISENELLFSLLGTTYGGDGQTTFAVPNLASRIPVGQGTNPQTGTNYVIGQRGGTENVTLTQTELPAHTHVAVASSQAGTQISPAGAVWAAQTMQNVYSQQPPTVQMSPQSLSPFGGNQPHDNMMPFLAINFIIATEGTYPSRD
ncbi:phage tail protein [Paenibacillus sp. IB182493]|uniref:Phage tail protein n=2 Tax=Paenibacillus arenilitoris TaxID=2772299 RepID=A0A927CGL6_9BACL|nr:phage tail protein [Paenibacillus arenilitoris]